MGILPIGYSNVRGQFANNGPFQNRVSIGVIVLSHDMITLCMAMVDL